jgi:FkbM family methyltransferase
LECNAAANKAKVEVLAACASDEIGYALLHYNNKVPLTTGASLEEGAILHNTFMAASRVTVDSLLLTNVAAIKIDVERHEPCVLRGAMSTIERDRPSLIIETLDAEMRNRILHMLPSYTVAAILDGRNTFFAPR